ncbi:CPBP family intramembrane metalloprotease [Saccharopolyspora sp. K220]|uniref:CPBP family intramembrane glutamic endopeptidase n=1 Tax=Saccharopolyspora soli TaxID=2926618 RepID=UPI001F5A4D06|nr:type II CAAX endopeptidase family protein [Saccharopolyspora soli]MCI2420505.1 CPBP family intramembrane metalloprotease [Saccharopolyspora soli]
MDTLQSERVLPSPLLGGIYRARRPTGPIVGLVVVVACLLVGQSVVALVLFPLFGVSPDVLVGASMGLVDQLALMLSFLGATGLLALWIWGKERRPFGSVGFFPAPRVGIHLLLGAVVAVVLLSVPVVVNILSGQLDASAFRTAQAGAAVVALVGFIAQASTEEIITRGYLMQVTYRKWGLTAAIVFQAVVFTVLHGVNTNVSAIGLLNILLIALVLAFWALAEGGLWGVCAFHVVWNWCQGNVYGIEVSGMDIQTTMLDISGAPGSADLLTGGRFGIEGSLLTTAVLALAAALAVIAYRRKLTAMRAR